MNKIYVALVAVIIGLVGAVVFLLNDNLSEDENLSFEEFTPAIHYTETVLTKDDFDDEILLTGTVCGDNFVQNINYTYKRDYKFLIEEGSVIPKKTPYLKIDGADKISASPMRIIKCSENNKNLDITYLDYSKLHILSYFNSNFDGKITPKTKVKAFFKNKPLENISISQIGYEIVDNKIELQLNTTTPLLSGSEVEIHVIFKTYKDQWILPNEFINKDSKGTYLTYLEDDQEKNVYIKVVCKGVSKSAIQMDKEYCERKFVYGNY